MATRSVPSIADWRQVVVGLNVHFWVESGCGAVVLGRPCRLPPPFVWRCLSGSAITPFPHPAHRTQQADFPHCALGQDLTPSPTTGRGRAGSDVRARSTRRGARVDRISPSQVTATRGNSAAGSAWARLPPTVAAVADLVNARHALWPRATA